jgi:alkylation response protein AidB-like acyl-CoA dehydrogenase
MTSSTQQTVRFALAEMLTEVEVAQAFVDRCLLAHVGTGLGAEQAAMAKWWATELHTRTVDRCLQLHGEIGYLADEPIGRAYVDARVTTIFGGTTEVMKDIVGRRMVRDDLRRRALEEGEPT